MSASNLMDSEQAAAKLNISVKTLDSWACRGGGPRFAKIGRLRKYDEADLDAFIELRKRASTSDPGPK